MAAIVILILVIAYVNGAITGQVCFWGSAAALFFLSGEVYMRKD